jgi:hypothetical protein
MHKKELITGLRRFISQCEKPWKGQLPFAKFLICYLENLKIPNDEKYDFWDITPHLAGLMVDAFEQLRTGDDEQTAHFRQAYEKDTGHKVPNIIDLGESNILDQGSAIQTTLGFMLREILENDWVEQQIDAYCNAQKYVLQQTFDKFLRQVYRQGLGEIINECTSSGMSGKFGNTELRTFITAGRIMFTFARIIEKDKESYYKKDGELYCNEWSVSFVGESDDPLCLSAGIQSVYCDFRTALDMIEYVIINWPPDAIEQQKHYVADGKVTLG